MDPYSVITSNSFLCVEILVLCSVISVRGLESFYKHSDFSNKLMYGYRNPLQGKSTLNSYVNEMYKSIDVRGKDIKQYDLLENDQALKYLEYGLKSKCDGYGIVQGMIGYTFIDPKLTHKDFVISGFYCGAPIKPVTGDEQALLFMSDNDSFHVINSGPKYLTDLKEFSDGKCIFAAALNIFYISPIVSRTGKKELYFSHFHCL